MTGTNEVGSGARISTEQAGTRDEAAQTRTTTVCAYREVGCNPTLPVQDNEIVKATSPHGNRWPTTPPASRAASATRRYSSAESDE
ncbi:hypothetical protein GCM10010211_45260 [Streptomyces albospinus]|uniref:Uncharacterized protein n=1 Tax=Streptomyces albospinus TaxID=285515 RepID=A0ABQ2VAJ3_9ACTN|nr:hypothetical protein GCM10010211_45260 [Streptomyces albospinus]